MEDDEKEAPKLVDYAKNSLFVRNLSPQVSELILREVFAQCDGIDKVTFRAYPNSNSQFYAQVDFATSKGVAEGSRLSGVPILGVPCEIGVIDPIATAHQMRIAAAAGGEQVVELEEVRTHEELNKRITEAAEDQRMRTVHVAGLAATTTEESLRRFCKNFGEVERLRVDKDVHGVTFGLVEFRERGPAHICKMQQHFLVDGLVLRCAEAKTMVDESVFTEQIVQFQAPILDAMNMRQVLSQEFELNNKLEQVRAAALELAGKDPGDSADAGAKEDLSASKDRNEKPEKKRKPADKESKKKVKKKKKKKKKHKKRKMEAKEKLKKENKKKDKKKRKDGQPRKRNARKKQQRGARRGSALGEDDPAAAREQEQEEEESEVMSLSESPGGPVDLDSEVELVGNTEFYVLGNSSASSVSSACSSEECDASPAISSSASPVHPLGSPARTVPLSVGALQGKWIVGGDPTGVWTVAEAGRTLFNGKAVNPKWSFVEETCAGYAVIFSRGQRDNGWELDMRVSSINRLVWKKVGEADTIWERQPEAPCSSPSPAAGSPRKRR